MDRTKPIKMAISCGLTALAAALALLARKPWSALAALAMAVSSVGDGLLAGWPACFRSVKEKLVKGGVVFFFAHCLYILSLFLASRQRADGLPARLGLAASGFAALTVLLIGLSYFRSPKRPPRAFFAACAAYLLAVGMHAALAVCAYASFGGAFILQMIGALLFFLSDAVLLTGKMDPSLGKKFNFLIWPTYVPAQLCLMLGFFLC